VGQSFIRKDELSWSLFIDELRYKLSKSSDYLSFLLSQINLEKARILNEDKHNIPLHNFLNDIELDNFKNLNLSNINTLITLIREWLSLDTKEKFLLTFSLQYLDLYRSLLRSVKHSEVASDVMIRINRLLLFHKSEDKILKLLENVSKKMPSDIRHHPESYQINSNINSTSRSSNKGLFYLIVILLFAIIILFTLYFIYDNNNSTYNTPDQENLLIEIERLYKDKFGKFDNRIDQIEVKLSELSKKIEIIDSTSTSQFQVSSPKVDPSPTDLPKKDPSFIEASNYDLSNFYPNPPTTNLPKDEEPNNKLNENIQIIDTNANMETAINPKMMEKMEQLMNSKMEQAMNSKMEQAMNEIGKKVVQVLQTQTKRNEEIIKMDEEVIKSFQQLSELKDE